MPFHTAGSDDSDELVEKKSDVEDIYVQCSNQPKDSVDSRISDSVDCHDLIEVFFVTPIICVYCSDYIWGSGKQGLQCKRKYII